MKFIDRNNEMEALSSSYERGNAEFIIITGRRRIGVYINANSWGFKRRICSEDVISQQNGEKPNWLKN